MTGIGLATAILVDVTLVRLVLAPASLSLLGDRIWRSARRVPDYAAAATASEPAVAAASSANSGGAIRR
jgi:RND superfamily putative drug exporter